MDKTIVDLGTLIDVHIASKDVLIDTLLGGPWVIIYVGQYVVLLIQKILNFRLSLTKSGSDQLGSLDLLTYLSQKA